MSIVAMEGFELNAAGQVGWSGSFDYAQLDTTVRSGGGGDRSLFLRTTNNTNSQFWYQTFDAQTDLFVKFTIWMDGPSVFYFSLYNQAGASCGTVLLSSGAGTLFGQSITGMALPTSTWTTFDVHVKVHSATGEIVIRRNGVIVFEVYNVDTTASGTHSSVIQWRILRTAGQAGQTNTYMDDIVVSNSSGSYNNGFLPDVRIVRLTPTSDAAPNDMTPSTGSSHYAVVDEYPASATDYLESSAAGDEEMFGLSDLTLPSGWGILALQMMGYQHETVAAGDTASEFGLRPDATDYWETTNQHLITTAGAYIRSLIYEENPETDAPWTDSDVDGLEAGIRTVTP